MISGRILQLKPSSVLANAPIWLGWDRVSYSGFDLPGPLCLAIGVDDPSKLGELFSNAIAQLPIHIFQRLRDQQANLLLDYSEEAFSMQNADLDGLYEALKHFDVQPENIFIVSQNVSFEDQHSAYCAGRNLEPVKVLTSDLMSFRMLQLTLEAESEAERHALFSERISRIRSGQPSRYSFLCMNNLPKVHRLCVALCLVGHKSFDQGMLSFAVPDEFSWKNLQSELEERFPSSTYLMEHLHKLRRLLPLTLDHEIGTEAARRNTVFSMPNSLYADSAIMICTESEMYDLSYQRTTEKSFKAFMAGLPTVVVGNSLSLRRLKTYGFETFSPVIRESYDELDSADGRMCALLEEIGRIINFSTTDQIKFEQSALEVSVHNFEIARGGMLNHFELHFQRIFSNLLPCSSEASPL